MSKITTGRKNLLGDSGAAQGSGICYNSGGNTLASDKKVKHARGKLQRADDVAESTRLERQLERPKSGSE